MKRMRIHVAVDNLNDSIQFAGKDTGLPSLLHASGVHRH
ncbi:MAG: hypothetical protein QOF46_373 [Paraburkholderia sp.]|nr:hypothetical protein [Paraburkholderia sp.]